MVPVHVFAFLRIAIGPLDNSTEINRVLGLLGGSTSPSATPKSLFRNAGVPSEFTNSKTVPVKTLWGETSRPHSKNWNSLSYFKNIHPGRLTWNLKITYLKRKIIFQTSIIMFHVNLRGCRMFLKGMLEEPSLSNMGSSESSSLLYWDLHGRQILVSDGTLCFSQGPWGLVLCGVFSLTHRIHVWYIYLQLP